MDKELLIGLIRLIADNSRKAGKYGEMGLDDDNTDESHSYGALADDLRKKVESDIEHIRRMLDK